MKITAETLGTDTAKGYLLGLVLKADGAAEEGVNIMWEHVAEETDEDLKDAKAAQAVESIYRAGERMLKPALEAIKALGDDLRTDTGVELTPEQVTDNRREINSAILGLMSVVLSIDKLVAKIGAMESETEA